MSEISQPDESGMYPRTEADAIAEQNAAVVSQVSPEKLDAFAPREHPIEYEHPVSRVAKQTGVRVGHAVWMGTGGRGAHTPSSRKERDDERQAVGLPPKPRF
jgi:hypothetical protein